MRYGCLSFENSLRMITAVLLVMLVCQTSRAWDVQPASYSNESHAPVYSPETKRQYLSQGQEYLRNYLREQVINFMISQGVAVDPQTMQVGMTVDLKTVYPLAALLGDAHIYIYADQELNHYSHCGRFLPVEIRLSSSYWLEPQWKIITNVQAPFDQPIKVYLGSELFWNEAIFSSLQYRLGNQTNSYEGFTMGLGWKSMDWQFKVNYDLNAEMVSVEHLSLSKSF